MVASVTADMTAGEDLVRTAADRLLAVMESLDDLWRTIGIRIQKHIAERWTKDRTSIAALAASTVKARERRWGYYRRSPGSASFLSRGTLTSFWWTGKALGRALGPDAFRTTKRALLFDFGIDNQPRQRLEFMHFGGKARPERPVYDLRSLHQIVDRASEEFAETLFRVFPGGQFRIARVG